jgi:F-box-like
MSKHPLLVEISNYGSETKRPTFRLPTELILLIFRECDSDILSRLTLTHTCQRWRQIALNDAPLWTKICIQTGFRRQNACLENFMSFLGMQLDRATNQLLDVCWYAVVGDSFFVGTLQLIREKAPFSQWRTLKLHMFGGSHKDTPWSSGDAFTNLESLRVYYGTGHNILSTIDHAITSRLKTLDLGTWPSHELDRLIRPFARSFTHISTFCFKSIFREMPTPFLHDNVVNLRLKRGDNHPFPHIRTYEVEVCTFGPSGTANLGNVTTLIVVDTLIIGAESRTSLPALRELKVGFLEMRDKAKIEAPVLDTLHFLKINKPGIETWTYLMPGYLLSPNTSLITDSPLPSMTFIHLLTKSRKVTNATLLFDDWVSAQVVLRRLLGFNAETNSHSAMIGALCPRLSELRLNFDWEFSDPSDSKEWLLRAIEARSRATLLAPLFIYACWRGEGRYLPLTGG